jgi:plasmid maintenance system antidote protein VapI
METGMAKATYGPDWQPDWQPDWTVGPGEVLRELLDDRGIDPQALADQLSIPADALAFVLDDQAPLPADLALALERRLGVDARIWARLDAEHQVFLARQRPLGTSDLATKIARAKLDLVGVAEVAEILGGVSRQYVDQLRHRPDFPEPVTKLACGWIWHRVEILAFAQSRKRRTPPKPHKHDSVN